MFMQVVAGPSDYASGSSIRRIRDALEKTPLCLAGLLLLVEKVSDCIDHGAGHRLVTSGGIHPQPAQQRLGQAQRDVSMFEYEFQFLTLSRGPSVSTLPARLRLCRSPATSSIGSKNSRRTCLLS